MNINNPSGGAASNLLATTGTNGTRRDFLLPVANIVTGASALNQVRAYRVVIGANRNMASVVKVLLATPGGKLGVALYDMDPTTGLPGNRVYQFAETDLSAVATVTSASLAIAPGVYWLVSHNGVAMTATGVSFATLNTGMSSLVNSADLIVGRLEATQAYAFPLPNPSNYVWTESVSLPSSAVAFKIT